MGTTDEILTITTPEFRASLRLAKSSFQVLRNSDPNFPHPIRLGVRTLRWRYSDVQRYLESRQSDDKKRHPVPEPRQRLSAKRVQSILTEPKSRKSSGG